MGYEAKRMCDSIKREKKLVTFSFCEPQDLEECCLIRMKALGAHCRILLFPCNKVSGKYNFSSW
jgi:hypothetical protein